ncbi:MAG: DegT/DnrJ/EryC1/StrS family aminotransferase [Cytophagales bacterium]|nr:DegT/DnrJ/EryC1/StrS family aminotransferase [Cytophagales bacterium]
MINCLDLSLQHILLKKEIFDAFEKVYDKTAFSGGSFVEEFEEIFSAYVGCKHTVGVNNGTSALHLSMLALNIGPGDEVIVPANTFIATAWGVSHSGATPVFVDCTSDTWEIDATKIESAITSKTKAVIGVHLYGQPFDLDEVKVLCDKHNIFLVEDAAQAQGARYKGNNVGSHGEITCYSYYPGKNLGACGEAGGITTNNKSYYRHLQSLRNHGSKDRYYHDELGFNMRMSGLEAVSLSVKLKYLEGWNNRRRQIAKIYLNGIRNPKIKMQLQPVWAESVYHLFVVTCDEKEAFVRHLMDNEINPGFHYPVPCHLQKAYSHFGYMRGDFPNSEYLANHCISLPMFAELSDNEVSKVIETVNSFT